MSAFFTFRDSSGVMREVEAYVINDYSEVKNPHSPVKTSETGYLHPSLIDPSTQLKPKTEFITLSIQNVENKKVSLEKNPVYTTISVVPEGGIGQRRGIDFIYIESENSISWADLGLDGYLEINEVLEVTYFHT